LTLVRSWRSNKARICSFWLTRRRESRIVGSDDEDSAGVGPDVEVFLGWVNWDKSALLGKAIGDVSDAPAQAPRDE
jgi:hypothetical protein